MSNAITFKILEDIARDLSGDEISFSDFPRHHLPGADRAQGSQPQCRTTGQAGRGRAPDERQDHPDGQFGDDESVRARSRRRQDGDCPGRHGSGTHGVVRGGDGPVAEVQAHGPVRIAVAQAVGAYRPRRSAVPGAGAQAGADQRRRGDVRRPGARPRGVLPDVAGRQLPRDDRGQAPSCTRCWSIGTRTSGTPCCRRSVRRRWC